MVEIFFRLDAPYTYSYLNAFLLEPLDEAGNRADVEVVVALFPVCLGDILQAASAAAASGSYPSSFNS
jgi:hypothetical protein